MIQGDIQLRQNSIPIARRAAWRRLLETLLVGMIAVALNMAVIAPPRTGSAAAGFTLSSAEWTLEYQVKVGTETFQVARLKQPSAMPAKIQGWPPLVILQNGKLPAATAPLDKIGLAVWARSDVYNQPAADLRAATTFHESRLNAIRGEAAITAVAGAVTGGATALTVSFLAPQFALPVTKGMATSAAKQLLESPRSYVAFFATSTGKSALHHYQQASALLPQVQVATVDADVARQYMVHMLQGRIFAAQSKGLFDMVVPLTGTELAGNVKDAVLGILKGGTTGILGGEAALATELAQLKFVEALEKVQSVIGELAEYKAVMQEADQQIDRSTRILSGAEAINAVTNTRALMAHASGAGTATAPDTKGLTFAPDLLGTPYSVASGMLSDLGIIKGYPDSTYRPFDPVTRAQIAVILLRTLKAEPGGNSTFQDLPAGHWAAPYVAEATRRKLLRGFQDGTFRPEGSLTEMEALTVAIRALGVEDAALGLGPWPDGYKKQAVKAGLLSDRSGLTYAGTAIRFTADQPASRGIVALLFQRMLLTADGSGKTFAERQFGVSAAKLAAYRQIPANTWIDVTDRVPENVLFPPNQSLIFTGVGPFLAFWNGRLAIASATELYLLDPDSGQPAHVASSLPETPKSMEAEGGKLYLIGVKGGAWVTTDGRSWQKAWQKEFDWATLSGQAAVLRTESFLRYTWEVSLDGGQSWADARQTWPELYPGQYGEPRLIAAGGAVFAVVDRAGIKTLFRLKAGGTRFESLTLGTELGQVDSVEVGPAGEIYLIGEERNGLKRLLVSRDDGKSWSDLPREGMGSDLSLMARGLVSRSAESVDRLLAGATHWESDPVDRYSSITVEESGRWLANLVGRRLLLQRWDFTGPAPVLESVGYTALARGEKATLALGFRQAAPGATFWIQPFTPLRTSDLNDERAWVVPRSRSGSTGGRLLSGRTKSTTAAEVEIPADLSQGLYNIGIQNPDGQTSWWHGAVSVGWKGARDFTKGGGIWAIRQTGGTSGELVTVDPGTGKTLPTMLASSQPVWAQLTEPRGDTVGVFTNDGPYQPLLIRDTIMYKLNPPGPTASPDGQWVFAWGYLLNHGVPVYGTGDTHAQADFSPGGDRVAISSYDRLVVIRLADMKVQVLDERSTSAPAWSHDGEWIGYQSPDGLSVTPADGRGERVKVAARVWSQPFWSPDGRLYYSDQNQIYSVLPDGSGHRSERNLTEWIGNGFLILEWK